MAQRTEKINELLKTELSKIIRERIDFPLGMLIAITRVMASPDIKSAKIYISVLPENMRGSALKILKARASELHGQLGKIMKTKFTPNLAFFIDEQEVFASEVDKILDEIRNK